jgi:hypothetical protein
MQKFIAVLAASAALALVTPVTTADHAFARDKAKSTEGNPTSNRTPEKMTKTPNSQVDTTSEGKTSDRTPNSGAASGEKGSSMGSGEATNAAWDATYQSDIAQEKQLKAGGGSK